jgi:hypothetical protein
LGHARSPRRLPATPMLPFERKASPSCIGRATVVNGRISCSAWLISAHRCASKRPQMRICREDVVLPGEIVMPATAMVDAALARLDRGEFATVPSLPNLADWNAYEAARIPVVSVEKN